MHVFLNQLTFDKNRKSLYVASELFYCGFPRTIDVVSNHTYRTMTFVQDDAAAVNAEFWDGEMMQYKVHGTDYSDGKITKLIVSHEF